MKGKRYSGYIAGAVLLLIGIYLIVTFNGLVKKEEQYKLQWNEVQNAYQRRLDLIPNLVNIVKGGTEYEQTTLQKISDARAKAMSLNVSNEVNAENFARQTAAQDQLAAAANRLMITVEKYPDLQGTRAFSDLQTQLEGTERRIKVARKDFNVAIAAYNSSVKSFPTSMVAGIFGFPAREGFESVAGAENAVEIKF
jgi:LemA protein